MSIRYTDTVNWKIREVVYSSPDSLGRQYPEKVTDILVDKYSRQEEGGEVVQEVEQYYQHGQVLHSEEKSLPPQGRNRTGILLAGCLVILGILFLVLQRRRLRSV